LNETFPTGVSLSDFQVRSDDFQHAHSRRDDFMPDAIAFDDAQIQFRLSSAPRRCDNEFVLTTAQCSLRFRVSINWKKALFEEGAGVSNKRNKAILARLQRFVEKCR
jgi:hypothetical protein